MQPGYYPSSHEPSGKAFVGSLLTHGVVVGLLVTSGLFNLSKNNFGSPHASSGSVGIDIVKTIPVPRREGPVNPLANDSTSVVPIAPAPPKPVKQVKVEPEKAIPIPDKVSKKKLSAKEQLEAYYKPPEPYKNNQVFSHTPQAANSPMFGMKGSAGIDIGQASVLGERFGPYVDLMTDRISQHWNRASVNSSPSQKCHVSFTIARNGTVSNVQVAEPSGNYLLDTSAKRAVLDASPLPPLPAQFERNEVTVDLMFQLKQ
jgi:periplasmic protein TonB